MAWPAILELARAQWRRATVWCGPAAAGLVLSGCVTSGYVEAEVPPADIEVYPYTYYDGQVVYLVGDRWYTRHNDVWVYYRSEPTYLRDYRVRYSVRYGSPSYHYRQTYYGAPPVRREAPAVRRREPIERREAEPARREAEPARREAPAAGRRP